MKYESQFGKSGNIVSSFRSKEIGGEERHTITCLFRIVRMLSCGTTHFCPPVDRKCMAWGVFISSKPVGEAEINEKASYLHPELQAL